MITKEEKRTLMEEEKKSTLLKNKNLISKHREEFDENNKIDCDLDNDKIYLKFCETSYDKQLWTTFVHLTSSLPYRGAVGRQVKLFVYCKNHILGMIHLTSPMAQLKLRDKFLKWDYEEKWKKRKINNIYNIETCIPTRKYSKYLTGKLLVYSIFSKKVKNYLENKYKDPVIGYETTSLFGKSSMYNRIPFLNYLGLTDGNSAIYISDNEWRKILDEYYKIYPNTKTNRIAPVKFQIIDKLANYYKKINKDFPYKYKKVEYKRGVYFGYTESITLENRINEWKNRWYFKRKKRVDE